MVKISTPKKDNKLIALLIVLVILISEICLIPSNILADSKNLENQNKATNNKYVNFDTYFINDGKNLREVEIKDESIGAINFELNVENGYLKDSSIALKDPNFSIKNSENEIIKNIENNVLKLKEINSNQKITMPILMDKKDIINLNYLNKETKIVFSGIFVSDNGKEQKIAFIESDTMKLKLSILALFILVAISVKGAVVDTLAVYSEAMKKNVQVVVVSPENNHVPKPVVYLLHGYGGNAKTWLSMKPELKDIADRDGLIFVCPDGQNSW